MDVEEIINIFADFTELGADELNEELSKCLREIG